jgi:hypothetical protein
MSSMQGNTSAIKPWVQVAALHPDALSENFSEDIFALDLRPLADGKPNVPVVYRDPEHFFRVSYLTEGLRSLLQDVLSRLSDGAGNRVLKLLTPFGGGKSHTLASLFHAARSRKALDVLPEAQGLPRPAKVHTAVFDGQFGFLMFTKDMAKHDELWIPKSREMMTSWTVVGYITWHCQFRPQVPAADRVDIAVRG